MFQSLTFVVFAMSLILLLLQSRAVALSMVSVKLFADSLCTVPLYSPSIYDFDATNGVISCFTGLQFNQTNLVGIASTCSVGASPSNASQFRSFIYANYLLANGSACGPSAQFSGIFADLQISTPLNISSAMCVPVQSLGVDPPPPYPIYALASCMDSSNGANALWKVSIDHWLVSIGLAILLWAPCLG